jgi:hypothetical protein
MRPFLVNVKAISLKNLLGLSSEGLGYRTWEDSIDPESLREARSDLENKADSFVLGMRFLGNPRFSQTDKTLSYVTAHGDEYHIKNDINIEASYAVVRAKTLQKYKDLRNVRNFVSHHLSDYTNTISFLKKELPSSVYVNHYGKEEARYQRDKPTHKVLVSKYQTDDRQWA